MNAELFAMGVAAGLAGAAAHHTAGMVSRAAHEAANTVDRMVD